MADSGTVQRPFRQVDVFSRHRLPRQPGRRRARRATGLSTDGHAAVRQLDEPVRDHLRAPARRRQGGLPGADLHPGPGAAVRRATPRSAPATPGWRRAGSPPTRSVSSRNAGPAWSEIRPTPDGLAFAAPPLLRSGPVDEPLAAARSPRCSASAGADIVDLQLGRQRPGLGRRPAAQRGGGAGVAAGRHRPRHRRGRAAPAGLTGRLRGPRVLPGRGQHRGGPRHRQPERIPCAVADPAPAGPPHRMPQSRAPHWAGPAGCTSRRTTAARSGSAAAR